MGKGKSKNGTAPKGPLDMITTVSDEIFEDLSTLTGEKILSFTLWDESLTEALTGEEVDPDEQAVADIDLYLEGGVYFELYGSVCYPNPSQPPLSGLATIQQQLSTLVNGGLWLDEFAVDEDEQLVLVLKHNRQPAMYVVVGGWTMDEWDELPEE